MVHNSTEFNDTSGGDIGKKCEELVSEISKQRQLDTEFTMIQKCAEFARLGITIDTNKFPNFELCSAVAVEGRTAVSR